MKSCVETFAVEYRAHALFVLSFWLLNAMEKLGLLGKDRWSQIAGYLQAFGASEDSLAFLVPVTLGAFALIQGAAATCAALAALRGAGSGCLRAALALSVLVFSIFLIGDVVAVERAQVLNHLIFGSMFILQGAALHVRRTTRPSL